MATGTYTTTRREMDNTSGGMGFDTHIRKYVSVRVGADFVYDMPYRIEHLYEARTSGDAFTVEIGSRLNVRIR